MSVQLGAGGQADFTEPIRLLMDCHRRIESFLGILQRVVGLFGERDLNDEGRRALSAALDYFAHAAPNHIADEEESLFPRLRDRADAGLRSIIEQADVLAQDHRRAEAMHARVEVIGRAWLARGRLTDCDLAAIGSDLRALHALYAAHIAFEDEHVFPAATACLDEVSLAGMGREMAQRRGLWHSAAQARSS